MHPKPYISPMNLNFNIWTNSQSKPKKWVSVWSHHQMIMNITDTSIFLLFIPLLSISRQLWVVMILWSKHGRCLVVLFASINTACKWAYLVARPTKIANFISLTVIRSTDEKLLVQLALGLTVDSCVRGIKVDKQSSYRSKQARHVTKQRQTNAIGDLVKEQLRIFFYTN